MKEKELIALEDLLNRTIVVTGNIKSDIPSRVDLLERLLNRWRFSRNKPDNDIPLERFLQIKTFIDNDKVMFEVPPGYNSLGSGTPPIRLQPTLLMYLLTSHRGHRQVLDVIKGYIGEVRPNLSELDFKKTRTGVTRCYTNTRFAANILRDYGFLKFTRTEAYKVWVLSLPGFIVASKVFEDNDWRLGLVEKEPSFDLHPAIRHAWDSFRDFKQFYDQLVKVCQPNIELFNTFGPLLKEAHNVLGDYWKTLNNAALGKVDRKKESILRLKYLEGLNGMEEFYKQFAMSVGVNKFVELMKEAASKKPTRN
jgi:hypothetical protein